MGHIFKELAKLELKPFPTSFPTRLVVELCECIHIHYRNIRTEFSDREFLYYVYTLNGAAKSLMEYRMKDWERKTLPIDSVDPWDSTHVKMETEDGWSAGAGTRDHSDRVKFVKMLIKEGRKITPILVKPIGDGKYKRMDGFCRYMAFKELGHTEIECFVDKNAVAGGQYNIKLTEEKDESQSWKR